MSGADRAGDSGAGLVSYSPRLLLHWDDALHGRHRAIDGTLAFADVSGFTRLSERLARAGGKLGAEQMTDIIDSLFGDLLLVAARRGGEMLKYGGDALLLFFAGEDHARRAVAACAEMQRRLRQIGSVDTGAGIVRLKMSVGVHTGQFDFFKVGRGHHELVIAGANTTTCVAMEAAADASEVLCSAAIVAAVGERHFGSARAGGRLLRTAPALAPAPELTGAQLEGGAEEATEPERFLAPEVRDHLARGAVEPDHRLVTVGFLHIMGMDALLAEAGPEVAAVALDDTMGCLQDALSRFEVTFLATDLAADGTKVMAAAGAPSAVSDDAGRMLLALRQIVEAKTPLPVRAGAQRGHVFSGAVGPSFRRTYTTIGDVTNTAARVMAQAGPGEVLALEGVVQAAAPSFVVTPRPPFAAKGKAEPLVPILVGPRRERTLPGQRAPRPPLVGRDAEMAILRRAVAAVEAGQRRVLALTGEPGMGKARVIDELVAEHPGLTWLRWSCDPYQADVPFAGVRGLVVPHLEDRGTDLRSQVRAHLPDLVENLGLIAAALAVDDDAEPTRELPPSEANAARTVDALAALLAHLVPGACLVLENVEWLDQPSRAVARRLAAATTPGLLCLTSRTAEPVADVQGAEQVEIGPLSRQASMAFVRRLVNFEILDHDLASVVDRAQGNPFFLKELVGAATGGGELPETLESLLATRIDDLDHDARDALRCAAVIGQTVDADLLAELIGDGAERLPETGLMSCTETGALRFQHSLVRDVAYERLPYRRRQALHRAVGELLEKREGTDAADALSLHFLLARDGERSWHYAVAAARQASRVHAHDVAAVLFRRATEARKYGATPDEGALRDVLLDLGHAHFWSGELAQATGAFRAARRLCRQHPVDRARSEFLEGQVAERRGDLRAARRWFRRALVSLHEQSSAEARRWRVRALLSEAMVDWRRGHHRDAIAAAADAAAEACAAGDVAGQAHALQLQFLASVALKLPDRRPLAHRALELFASLDPPDLKERANVLNNLGLDAQGDRALEDALSYFEQSREAQRQAGNAVGVAAVENNIGEILVEQGDLEEAERRFEQARGAFAAAGSWYVHIATANLASLHATRGDTDRARQLLEATLAEARPLGIAPLLDDLKRRLASLGV